ncbi:hypothetical protein V5799_018037 [Amblyomma americanum]|uniref:L27 domain-containing protein n=1 Tax=Amblyomma americanum TaxID=6943 RepID=A0AAQ4F0E7_AMBAM
MLQKLPKRIWWPGGSALLYQNMAAVGESLMLERDIKRACELLEKLQRSGEVPAQKLAALQKVLQSEFCNAVREVYEHVYETVDISGSPDIRASATAKVRLVSGWLTDHVKRFDLNHCGCSK